MRRMDLGIDSGTRESDDCHEAVVQCNARVGYGAPHPLFAHSEGAGWQKARNKSLTLISKPERMISATLARTQNLEPAPASRGNFAEKKIRQVRFLWRPLKRRLQKRRSRRFRHRV
jgi:hypothetical protein